MKEEVLSVRACIAGGGPAGMILGLLLARAGVEVVVLEKHADFLRDFRGDTIHPSTLEVMHELGLLEDLLKLPHQKAERMEARMGDATLHIDFSHLSTRCRYIAFMPQWDFLNFVAAHAKTYSSFQLRTRAEVTDLIEEGGRVTGVRAATPDGALRVSASLVVGCDGRHSVVRDRAGLTVTEIGAPMDVLWFRLSRRPGDPSQPMARFESGGIFVMLNQGGHWQCGFVIPKGAFAEIRAKGLPAFRDSVSARASLVTDRVAELRDWEQVKLLTVRVDRLERWYREGLLCIGDAAHAMSPVGGVGINLAIQDAVATANLLTGPLRAGRLTVEDLKRVQQRREFPTRVTQRIQVAVQNRIVGRILGGSFTAPLAVRLMARFPWLRRIPGWLIGNGIRPEHVTASSGIRRP
jgi:2-polyprenyl-6-methoxyphenol hydroxylase-like FAD-dependent oxidoreductase